MTLKTSLLTAASAALVAPGGHIEGAHGWSLSGASVTAGNEPWRVRAAGDSKALTIAPGGSATSPAFCVGAEHPTFRLFATRGRGLYGMLNVSIVTANGTTQVAPVVDGKTGWKPSDDLMLSTVLADTYVGKTAAVRVKLSVDTASAPWTVDDVFVDPYRRG
jgi:hypothetical protein